MPDASGSRFVRIEPPIKPFMAALKASPDRLDLVVRKRFREIAARIRDSAREAAASNAPHPGSNPRSVHASRERSHAGQSQHWKDLVNSITSGSTSNSPHVSIGSDRVPWALGFEFGSHGGPHKQQFPPWRGRGSSAGYFFFPEVRAATPGVREDMVAALNEALHEAFPDA